MLPHIDAAYNLARWLCRSPAEAEDAVQDAMLRALKSVHGLRGGVAKPWLLAIVRNCCRNAASRSGGAKIVALEDVLMERSCAAALISSEPTPEMNAMAQSEQNSFDSVLAGLPAEFREVLILRELEELSYREIAQITAVPIGTVMSRLSRARALLKERWLATERAA